MGKLLSRIWVFDEQRLETALRGYEKEALAAYPEQEERIRVAVMAIRDFLNSNQARTLVMKLSDN